jgi:[acyl-carrier-protein] S-malonyltransferase
MFAIVAPGQGAQTAGFLHPWLQLPDFADRLRWWSAVTGVDLVAMGTTADTETIRDTAVAQPLLVAAGLGAAAALVESTTDGVGVAAGHSVGELTAAVLAGALAPEAALVLVRERGRAMAAASRQERTGMTAILGGDQTTVDDRLAELGLTAANRNGAGQVVAAGRADALAALAADPPAGSRLRPLSVAGAFHTSYMEPAQQRLADLAAGIPVRDPAIHLLSNADGQVVQSGSELIERLVAQVAAPVRWDLCMRTLGELGVTAVVELPPAGTLSGLLRRELPGIQVVALRTPADLPAARALLSSRREHAATEPAPAWRVVVAPLAGTFRPATARPGDHVDAGDSVGTVVARRIEEPVPAPYGGVVVEWLAEDGDPVGPGQPLVRLHPETVPA